jgi:hypothetical protein
LNAAPLSSLRRSTKACSQIGIRSAGSGRWPSQIHFEPLRWAGIRSPAGSRYDIDIEAEWRVRQYWQRTSAEQGGEQEGIPSP